MNNCIPKDPILRITVMEAFFDALIAGDETPLPVLRRYYESGLWLSDYTLDEQGGFPAGLKRGVLSQDGLWNVLNDHPKRSMDMIHEKSRTWAEINTSALIHNFRVAKRCSGKKIMCVIKGDAHGHGAVMCGKVLEAQGADAFAVACLAEGIALRKSGSKLPILVLGYTDPELVPQLLEYDLEQSVFDPDYAAQLNRAASGKTLGIHVKLDTGMSRTGIFAQHDPMAAARTVLAIHALENLKIKGIFTHCAAADMPEKDDFTRLQIANYKAVLSELEKLGFAEDVVHHAGNSAVILNHPDAHFDMVRMGVMMYGFYPDGIYRPDGPLRQILTLKTRVAQVKTLPEGALVSYGCTYRTGKETTIAIVAAGYADSYPRSLSNKGGYAVINGQKCPQIGRICMDMCMFDVTGVDVSQGDEVILYGQGGMSLDEIAALTGSINCEMTCLLTNRVPKIYL